MRSDPVNPNDAVPCMGRIMCPDQLTCVTDAKYCTRPTEWGPIVTVSYYAQQFSNGLRNFDMYREIARAKKCYKERPFSRSPYNPRFVFQSMQQKTIAPFSVYRAAKSIHCVRNSVN